MGNYNSGRHLANLWTKLNESVHSVKLHVCGCTNPGTRFSIDLHEVLSLLFLGTALVAMPSVCTEGIDQ